MTRKTNMNESPFGFISHKPADDQPTMVSFNPEVAINPEDFETRVFSVKKEKSVTRKPSGKSKFISSKRTSKFLKIKEYVPTLHDRKEEWKNTIKDREQIIEDKIKIHIPKQFKEKFLESLHNNTESYYEFFMQEIIPVYAALAPALERTVEHASHILKTDAEIELDEKLFKLIEDAITLKVFEFTASLYKLNDKQKDLLKTTNFNINSELLQKMVKK